MHTEKQIGSLFYDKEVGRMNIRFGLDEYYGGLHCGDCLDVLLEGEWISTRIEMGDDWYLVGIDTNDLVGLIVKM